ncbi:excisionase [Erwinia tracheiphila]|uniref:excisionase n=1 Tax=Erwinia tracheiphila TaxID=65700 RepID=UPI000334E983|nr:excisionase [Erwinia tracheiphila]EOS94698.1 Excisionase domain protein [Erwinia tracheiphila PSU-1]UIA88313.1 excisionase [Erwinia tracheiphila]UIA96266.1 excisionase [Erwinia tracheiphila]
MPLITLHEWGQRLPVPRSTETLRRWARGQKIYPPPQFDGYQYYVDEDAVKITHPSQRQSKSCHSVNSLTSRIKNGRTEKKP